MTHPLPDLLEDFPGGADRLTPSQRAVIALFMAAGILALACKDATLGEVLSEELQRWGSAEGIEL